jgi:hypothetical protein
MKPPSPQARQLLEHYRASATLSADAKARLGDVLRERALRGDLPRFDVQPLPSGVPGSSLAARLWGSTLAKVGLGLVVAGAASGLVYQATRPGVPSRPEAPVPSEAYAAPAVSPLPPAVAEAAPALPASEPTERTIAPSEAPRRKAERAAEPAAASAEPTIDDEVKLMNAAQAALRAGDAKRALSLSNEHAARFPTGKLATARKVTRMMALCQAGSTQQARREAADFLAKNPASPFAERVRGICASTP